MVKIRFRIEEDFNLPQQRQKLMRRAKLALFDIMLAIQNRAKKEAPVDTGALRSSITLTPKRPAINITAADGVEYGSFVEFGTVNQRPNPFFRRAQTQVEKIDIPRILKKHNFK